MQTSEALPDRSVPTSEAHNVELITPAELAARWSVREGWVRKHSWDCMPDPIPNYKLGIFVRYRWGSSELNRWIEKRRRGAR